MSGNQSIKRAFSILKAVSTSDTGVGVTEISNQIDLHKSTVSRMLATLEEVGAVERISNGEGFRIGGEIANLAAQISYPRHLQTLARPFLLELAQATSETINLAIPEGEFIRYIDQIDSQYNLQIRDWTGYRIPLHATCDGKMFLAHWPPDKLEAYLARPLQRFSENTLVDPDQLRPHLAMIKAQGHAWTYGEYEAEIVGISVPVWDEDSHIVATLCVGGPGFRFPAKGEADAVIDLMKTVSRQLSTRLNRH
ncbi:MAG: IclR family transcriptional regulator [Chloroflexota bacterium]